MPNAQAHYTVHLRIDSADDGDDDDDDSFDSLRTFILLFVICFSFTFFHHHELSIEKESLWHALKPFDTNFSFFLLFFFVCDEGFSFTVFRAHSS